MEVGLPQAARSFEPAVGLIEGAGDESADVCTADATAAHEFGSLEHANVLGRGREGHAQRRGEFREVQLAPRKPAQHVAAGGMGKGVKDAVEIRGAMENHVV